MNEHIHDVPYEPNVTPEEQAAEVPSDTARPHQADGEETSPEAGSARPDTPAASEDGATPTDSGGTSGVLEEPRPRPAEGGARTPEERRQAHEQEPQAAGDRTTSDDEPDKPGPAVEDVTTSTGVDPVPPESERTPDSEEKATPAQAKPTTLVAYLSAKVPAAPAFLAGRESAGEGFEPSDVEEAVELVQKLDPSFRKTLALTRAAFGRRTGAAMSAREFAAKAVRREMATGPDPFAQPEADQAIRVASHGVRLRLDAKKTQARAIGALTTALLLLSERPDFRIEAALRAFDEAQSRRLRSRRADSTPGADAMEFLASLASRPQDLDVAVRLAYGFAVEAGRARDAEMTARAAAERDREKAEDLQRRLDVAEAALREAEHDAADLREALDDARRQADDARRAASHEVAAVRRRARAFLTDALLPPLEVAAEASEIQPPRVHIVEEQLDVASTRLRKEIERLARPEE